MAQTVQKVGARAFANTSDFEVVLLQMRVGSVAEGAFDGCSGYRGAPSLVLPSSANIGDGAFEGSGFSEVVFAFDGSDGAEGRSRGQIICPRPQSRPTLLFQVNALL